MSAVPLDLIDKAMCLIDKENLPDLEPAKRYLDYLCGRIREHCRSDSKVSMSIEAAQTIYLFAHVVCDYYRSLQRYRPLTPQELEVGQHLQILLQTTMDTLVQHFRSAEGASAKGGP